MENKIIKSNNFSDIYRDLIYNLYYYPEYISSPRGLKIKEITNIQIQLNNPTSNLYFNYYRSPHLHYLYGELLWYFLGRNDLKFISKYSKFWNNIANEDGTVNSAYGYLLFNEKNEYNLTEYQWALNSLKRDKYTRQAILRFNKPKHSYFENKDFVCTLNAIFHIRLDPNTNEEKLFLTTIMRSQDIWFGIIYDIPFYTLLQQQMHKHLLKYYPNLKLGSLTHFVSSIHIYEKNFKDVEKMLNYDFHPGSIKMNYTIDLINEDGSPSNDLLKVYNCLQNNKKINFKDPLFNDFIKYAKK